jgi:hypothetical protein
MVDAHPGPLQRTDTLEIDMESVVLEAVNPTNGSAAAAVDSMQPSDRFDTQVSVYVGDWFRTGTRSCLCSASSVTSVWYPTAKHRSLSPAKCSIRSAFTVGFKML